MIEKTKFKNIYKTEVALPNSPLKMLNSYVIKSENNRNLIIDLGFNAQESLECNNKNFKELKLDLNKSDIFLTHAHVDHSGLINHYKNDNNKIFMSKKDANLLHKIIDRSNWDEFDIIFKKTGFSDYTREDLKLHPAYRYAPIKTFEHEEVKEGDRISFDDLDFEFIDLSGHTPGQMGLYSEKDSILFCGDHILYKITPNISVWDLKVDYLGLFIENLKKVKKLDIQNIFTAHRNVIDNTNKRIDELINHHEERLDSVLKLLKNKDMTALELAYEMQWDYAGGKFENFPFVQKWFAVSEVFAHTEYLRRRDLIQCDLDADIWVYTKK